MKQIIRKRLAVMLTAVLAAGIMLTACGETRKPAETAAGTASGTTAETAPPAAPATAAPDIAEASAGQQTDETEEAPTEADQTADADENADSYIDEADAVGAVRELVGSGAQILSCEKGTAPDGDPAWVISVLPVTPSPDPEPAVYYAGEGFCYRAE